MLVRCSRLSLLSLLSLLSIESQSVYAQSPVELQKKLETLETRINELISADSTPPVDCTADIRIDDRDILEDKDGMRILEEQANCYDYIEKMMVGQSDCLTTPQQGRHCLTTYVLPDDRLRVANEYKRHKEANLENWLSYAESFKAYLKCEISSFCWNDAEVHSQFRDKDVEAYSEVPFYGEWLRERSQEAQ